MFDFFFIELHSIGNLSLCSAARLPMACSHCWWHPFGIRKNRYSDISLSSKMILTVNHFFAVLNNIVSVRENCAVPLGTFYIRAMSPEAKKTCFTMCKAKQQRVTTNVFICFSVQPCPTSWINHLGWCYLVPSSTSKKNFADARSYCQSQGGDLPIVEDGDTNIFITGELLFTLINI